MKFAATLSLLCKLKIALMQIEWVGTLIYFQTQHTQSMSSRPPFLSTKLWGSQTRNIPRSTAPINFVAKKNARAGNQFLMISASPL